MRSKMRKLKIGSRKFVLLLVLDMSTYSTLLYVFCQTYHFVSIAHDWWRAFWYSDVPLLRI